jgi:hypothetical protein
VHSRDTRDIIGGVLMAVVGLFFALHARNYHLGEAARMGPGYFPTMLGWTLTVLGVLIALAALRRPGEAMVVRWKSLAFVVAAVVYFAFSLPLLGLVVAVAGAVFLGSLADKDLSWRGRIVLSATVPVLMVLVFITGLGMNLPLFGR